VINIKKIKTNGKRMKQVIKNKTRQLKYGNKWHTDT
jgi:predicted amino acid racemase